MNKKSTNKNNSSSVFGLLFSLLALTLLIIDVSSGAWALVHYANGFNVADSPSAISVSCVAQPSEGHQYSSHRVNGGSLIEPNLLLVVVQVVLLLITISLALCLFKYRGGRFKVVAIGGLICILIAEITMLSVFHSAVTLLCFG